MHLEVFLKKNQLLALANKKLSESPNVFLRWMVITELVAVDMNSNSLIRIEVRWSIRHVPFAKGISNFKIILKEGVTPNIEWKMSQLIIKGWKTILNDLITRQWDTSNLKNLNVWPGLARFKLNLVKIEHQKETIGLTLLASGVLRLEIEPEMVPIFQSNEVDFQILNLKDGPTSPFTINLNLFNNVFRKLSREISIENSSYLGISLGKVLLKFERGQMHLITQIIHPFNGFVKTSCGLVLEGETGKLILSDVESRLETNNFLAQMAHLGFKKSFHQLMVNRLEQLINLKLKKEGLKQLGRIGALKNVKMRYKKVEIENNILKLTIDIKGGVAFFPSLLN
jgi:hypothetical protein